MIKRSIILRITAIILLVGVIAWGYARQVINKPQEPAQEAIADNEETDEQELEDAGTPTDDDPFKEMDHLVNAYYKGSHIQLKGSVKLIDDNAEEEKVIEQYPFTYQYAAGDFYYKLDSMEFAGAGGQLLVVDHRAKAISLTAMADSKKMSGIFNIADFRKMIEEQKASAKVTEAGGVKMLTLENIQDPQIQAYRIYYDPVTYSISKILIGMVRLEPLEEKENEVKEEGVFAYNYYMELSYSTRESLRTRVDDVISRFLIKRSDSYVLQPAYSSYDLNDFTRQPASINQELPISE
jgi:hypothetical protein